MKLLIDLGNTRLKWAHADHTGCFLKSGSLSYSALQIFLDHYPFPDEQIQQVWVASVSETQYGEQIEKRFKDTAQVYHLRTPPVQRCGVTHCYSIHSRLGIDRWLGLVAAHHCIKGPAMVVDAGTAVTLDCIAEDGTHQGGMIVPGLSMMKR